ncbi:Ubiquitin-conjugating enzyme E2 2 [Quillaja saponaria]|uniref:Ubiquitin-conjugating enzyme E2 2 n=1 Tax=Quillaja saponaria TaxID=32244 RepID=A0AAD7L6V9_QUISA|nr:Ubiquitin-conjugating enzyme E2 2 [Quillaja saponaria]
MASSAQLRLMSDLKSIINEPPEGCSASPMSDENLFVWSATIFGPDETPWEGVVFSLRLTFGDSYPEMPPRVRFTSEMFHPNGRKVLINRANGNSEDAWSPCHNVSTILTSVQSLLTDPNPASPANPEAAQFYQHDIQAYNKRVRCCARRSIESA